MLHRAEGELELVADNSAKEGVALDFFSPAESGRDSGISASVLQKKSKPDTGSGWKEPSEEPQLPHAFCLLWA